MGVITLKIDDELENKLRKRVGRSRGAARGAISESVGDAIRLWLKTEDDHEIQDDEKKLCVAMKNDQKIAEASSLELLSAKLKELKCDPRDVIIESVPHASPTRRMGLRTTTRRITH